MDRKQNKPGDTPDSIKKGTDRSGMLIGLILLTVSIVVLVLNFIFNTEANTSTPAIIVFVLYCLFIAGTWVLYIIRHVRQNRLNKNEKKHASNSVNNTVASLDSLVTTHSDVGSGASTKDSSSAEIAQWSKTDRNAVFNNETTVKRKSTFVCSRCKKELAVKYLYKQNMCTTCYEITERERGNEKKRTDTSSVRQLKTTLLDMKQQSWPGYSDPYSYIRENVWKYQVELMYIPSHTPVRKPGSDSSRDEIERYYTSGQEIIYIDDRNGDLVQASYSVPAFNAGGASRTDYPITYEELHELVTLYLDDLRVKFCVEDRSALLELNKDNWIEWMLTHLKKYRSPKTIPKETISKSGCKITKIAELESYLKSHDLLENAYLCVGSIERGPDRVSVVENAERYDIYISDEKGSVNYLHFHEGISIKEARSVTEEEACKIIIDLFRGHATARQHFHTETGRAETASDSRIDSNGYLHYKLLDNALSSDEMLRLTHLTISASRLNRTSIVSMILRGSFKDCTKLVYVQIQEGVSIIGAEAFDNCISLQTVVLPASLNKIDGFGEYEEGIDDGHGRGVWHETRDAAFGNCPGLKKAYYRGTKEQWSKIEIGLGNNCLLNAEIEYNYRRDIQFGGRYHIYHDFGTAHEFFAEVFDFERVTRFYPFSLFDRDWAAGIRAYRLAIFICERHSVYENGVCIYSNPHFSGGSDSLFRGSTEAYAVPGWKGTYSLECAIEKARRMSTELKCRTAVVRFAGEHDID